MTTIFAFLVLYACFYSSFASGKHYNKNPYLKQAESFQLLFLHFQTGKTAKGSIGTFEETISGDWPYSFMKLTDETKKNS